MTDSWNRHHTLFTRKTCHRHVSTQTRHLGRDYHLSMEIEKKKSRTPSWESGSHHGENTKERPDVSWLAVYGVAKPLTRPGRTQQQHRPRLRNGIWSIHGDTPCPGNGAQINPKSISYGTLGKGEGTRSNSYRIKRQGR